MPILKADTLTAGSGHAVDEAVNDAIRAAITRLIQNRDVDLDAYAGPIYFMIAAKTGPGNSRPRSTPPSTPTWDLSPVPSLPRLDGDELPHS
jgi:hypothetical protein